MIKQRIVVPIGLALIALSGVCALAHSGRISVTTPAVAAQAVIAQGPVT